MLRKLEYVERMMREVGGVAVEIPPIREEYLPVESMTATLGEHHAGGGVALPLDDPAHFDGDLRTIFAGRDATGTSAAAAFIRRRRRELVGRVAYWTGESGAAVRAFIDHLEERAEALALPSPTDADAALVELTAFATAVVMNYRAGGGAAGVADA